MARIPGLDVFGPTERSPNIFDEFFPIPDNIGNMRREEDYSLRESYYLKAPVNFAICSESDHPSKKEITLLVYKETQNLDEELKDILHETQIITMLNHENVLKFYEFVSGANLTDVAFIFEPVCGLMSHIIAKDVPNLYEPPFIKNIMHGLFTALAYLHQKKIIHRDIQPENIAFSNTGVLKVWNFRNARKLGQKPKKLKANEFRYQAVDVLLSDNYDESVDIWAANCIFAQLWLKNSLFPEHGREKVLAAIFKLLGFPGQEIWEEFYGLPGADNVLHFRNYCKYNMIDSYFKKYCDRSVPPTVMDLIHKCFRYNPKYRPNAEKCLVHPYFFEDPKACTAEDMLSIFKQVTICDRIREIRNKQQQSA